MSPKISKELSKHRLEQAKEDLTASKILYDMKLFKSANNRAYYSIFHSMKAVLALEPIDFKRHKDVIAYFNKNYIHTEIFSKILGRKISEASRIREDSDYDDEFVVRPEDTLSQIETAKEIIALAENYINAKK
ncbi:MAG: HEPN domain-containing protein [Clostridia bacterium]